MNDTPRVQAIADLHGFLPLSGDIPDCDILLIAGDVCPDFHHMSRARYGSSHVHMVEDKGEQRQRHWLETTFRLWLEDLAERNITVIGIWGNHDYVGEHSFLIPDDLEWTLLQDSGTYVHGLQIWGTPWCPALPRWAFYANERALELRAESIPNGLDILMSHSPPYGHCDFVVPRFGSTHVGDGFLTRELDRIKAPLLVCGHIHEGRGFSSVESSGTTIVNVAHVDENYEGFRGPVDLSPYVVKVSE